MSAISESAQQAAAGLAGRGPFIGGEHASTGSGGWCQHTNPYTGQAQFGIRLGGADEIDRSVEVARAARRGWAARDAAERQSILLRIADLVDASASELGGIMAVETGIPIAHGPRLVAATTSWIRYYANWIDKIDGQVLAASGAALDYTRLEPYGVVAVIPAFNAGVTSMGQKVAPALAAGNTVVVKPSELSPLAALRFAQLAAEAGLPPGVLNVVPGGAPAGASLVRNRGIDKLTFTGGAATAQAIMAELARTLKPVVLELGGKSANVVFADADLDTVIPVALDRSVLLSSGQICLSPSRLLVERAAYAAVLERLEPYIASVPAGDPFDTATRRGPMISEMHMNRVLGIIDRARRDRAGTLMLGGSRSGGDLGSGFFVDPTVFIDVDHRSSLAQEEVFGPVLSVLPFDTEEEAIGLANDSPYGLAAYVHTNDLRRAHRMAAELEAGYVNVNGFAGLAPNLPFGGYNESGFGREGGRAGLDEFLQIKNVFIAG